ncbi:MAG: hypothetical protein QXU18_04620 [Thermoplasmatales archaeon]
MEQEKIKKCKICGEIVSAVFNPDNGFTFMGIGAMHWLHDDKHKYMALQYIYNEIGKRAGTEIEFNERQLYTTLYPDGDIMTVELGVYDLLYDFIEKNSEKVILPLGQEGHSTDQGVLPNE